MEEWPADGKEREREKRKLEMTPDFQSSRVGEGLGKNHGHGTRSRKQGCASTKGERMRNLKGLSVPEAKTPRHVGKKEISRCGGDERRDGTKGVHTMAFLYALVVLDRQPVRLVVHACSLRWRHERVCRRVWLARDDVAWEGSRGSRGIAYRGVDCCDITVSPAQRQR